jgi:hypothetical protein
MTSSPHIRSVRRVVRFVQTETDQALLQAVEEALESQFHGNFSALCKQALRHFLLPHQNSQVISPIAMQEQIVELQERVARLEAMGDRLAPQEQIAPQPPAELPEPPPEIDPLLSRLALLLEDFSPLFLKSHV